MRILLIFFLGCTAQFSHQLDPAACEAPIGGPVYDGNVWHLDPSGLPLRCAVDVGMGDSLVTALVFLQRIVPASTTATVHSRDPVTGVALVVGSPVTDGSSPPGDLSLEIDLTENGKPFVINDDTLISVAITGTTDVVSGVEIYGER